jgi:DNA-binding transcriptional ArsR family regulator
VVGRTRSKNEAPDAVLRALADPHRRQILRLVQHGELPAGQIAARFTLTQQAVSQHIGVLKSAGLLTERRDGTRRLYSLRPERLLSAFPVPQDGISVNSPGLERPTLIDQSGSSKAR